MTYRASHKRRLFLENKRIFLIYLVLIGFNLKQTSFDQYIDCNKEGGHFFLADSRSTATYYILHHNSSAFFSSQNVIFFYNKSNFLKIFILKNWHYTHFVLECGDLERLSDDFEADWSQKYWRGISLTFPRIG